MSSVAALLFLDPYPLLLATYADGAIRVWGVKGSPLKGLLVLTFPNQAPTEAYFWGDEDAEYPLLRYTAMFRRMFALRPVLSSVKSGYRQNSMLLPATAL